MSMLGYQENGCQLMCQSPKGQKNTCSETYHHPSHWNNNDDDRLPAADTFSFSLIRQLDVLVSFISNEFSHRCRSFTCLVSTMLPHKWHTPRFCPTMWVWKIFVLPLSSLCWTCRAAGTQVASCPWTRYWNHPKKAPQAAWLQMDMKGYSGIVIGCSATTAWTGYRLELQWAPSDGRLILMVFNKFHKCSTSPWVSGTTRILQTNHRSSGQFPDVNKGRNFKLSK